MRTAVLAFACAAAIITVVGCRQVDDTAAPLRDRAPLTLEQQAARTDGRAAWDASVAFEKAAREMTPQQVTDAEAAWRKNPDDLETLKKLLIHYGPDQSGRVAKDTDANVAARRPLILWLIEHQPESILTWHADPRFSRLDPAIDPEGYRQARRLWLAHTSRPDARAHLLDHAATFFESTEPALAEAFLTRARQVDPEAKTLFENGEPLHWSSRFAELYCLDLAGSDEARRSAARNALQTTQDDLLLAAAGRRLWNCVAPTTPRSGELVALAKSSFERALRLDSQSLAARAGLVFLAVRDRELRVARWRKDLPLEKEYEFIARLPETERLDYLPWLADTHYEGGESKRHDRPQAAAHYALSKRYAEDALAVSREYPTDPNYGTAVYRANVTLGMHALREGDRREAVRYMLEAAKAPPSDETAWSGSPLQGQLAAGLLDAGERESVATFLERSASMRMFPHERERQLKAAADIRAGVKPAAY